VVIFRFREQTAQIMGMTEKEPLRQGSSTFQLSCCTILYIRPCGKVGLPGQHRRPFGDVLPPATRLFFKDIPQPGVDTRICLPAIIVQTECVESVVHAVGFGVNAQCTELTKCLRITHLANSDSFAARPGDQEERQTCEDQSLAEARCIAKDYGKEQLQAST